MEPTPFKKCTKPDDPPQNVDKPHLIASISTITNLDVTCALDTSCNQLLHLDPSSHSSDPQDISSVENVEIEFLPEIEVQLDYANLSPTDVFLGHHDYDLILLNQEIDTILNFQNIHVCDNEDVSLIHATNLSHTFALLQFMAQHNYKVLKPTGSPREVPTTIQASNDHPFNPWCAHNLMATQCNQSQYPNPTHKFALQQLMEEPNCEDLEPTYTPTYTPIPVPTALPASNDHTFYPKCAHKPNGNSVQSIPVPHLIELNLPS